MQKYFNIAKSRTDLPALRAPDALTRRRSLPSNSFSMHSCRWLRNACMVRYCRPRFIRICGNSSTNHGHSDCDPARSVGRWRVLAGPETRDVAVPMDEDVSRHRSELHRKSRCYSCGLCSLPAHRSRPLGRNDESRSQAVQDLPPELRLQPAQVQGLMAGLVPIVCGLYNDGKRVHVGKG